MAKVASGIAEARFVGGIVDGQGRFVLYGNSRAPYFGSYLTTTALGRLTADGAVDTTFGGGDGLATITDDDVSAALDVDELADGRLWVTANAIVGSAPLLGAWGFALFNGDGTPATSYGFDNDGVRTVQIGSGQTVSAEAPGESVLDAADQTPLPAIKPSAVFTLPSAKRCASRRSFRIRLKAPKGVKLASATVRVNNKLVKTVTGKRLTAPVDLRGLPKGRFTVKVEAKTTDGRVVRDTRTYRTCVKRR
jgi:hypothetical protein